MKLVCILLEDQGKNKRRRNQLLKRNTQLYNVFLHSLLTLSLISLWFRGFNTLRIYKLCKKELNTYILKIFQLPTTSTIHTRSSFTADGFSSELRELPLVISQHMIIISIWMVYRRFRVS